MNIIIYVTIFLIGIMFGSFYTLATYRIPQKQDITHKHSYCPNCKSKLGFFELIPVLSYIFLGGKCKYCKNKIGARYITLELLSGLTFILFAMLLNLNVNSNIQSFIYFIFVVLYLTFIFLTAGIDKENRKIEKSVLSYALIISILYIVYLYIVEKVNIYRYIIYILAFIVFLLIDIILLKRKKTNYWILVLMSVMIMAIFTGEFVAINTIIVTILAVAIYLLLNKLKNKMNKNQEKNITKELPMGYFLCISNIIIFCLTTILIS